MRFAVAFLSAVALSGLCLCLSQYHAAALEAPPAVAGIAPARP
jgi:hypothetical protein